MPLDATNFVFEGTNKSADHLQFYNLLTGVMNDQPVTIANSVTVGAVPMMLGGNPTTNVPFIVPAVSGALVFGTNQVGRWQIALGGDLLASANGVYNIGGTALNRPNNIYAVGGVNAATFTATTSVTSPLYNVGATTRYVGFVTASGVNSLNIVNVSGPQVSYIQIFAEEASMMYANVNPTTGQFIDAAYPSSRLIIGASYGGGVLSYETAAAGATALTQKWYVDVNGNSTFQGAVSVGATAGTLTANHNLAVGGNILMNPGSAINFANGAVISQYTNGTDVRVAMTALTVTPGPTSVAGMTCNGTLSMSNYTIQYINTLYGHNNTCYMDMSAGTGVSLHGTLQVDGGVSLLSTVNVAGVLTLSGGYIMLSNLTIQYCTTLYGQNNSCYLTNDGTTWSSSGPFSAGTNLTVGGTISSGGTIGMGGIYLTLNQYASQPYGIITTGGGDLYVRCATGIVHIDSGPIVMVGSLTGGTIFQFSQYGWAPTIYLGTSQTSTPYLQGAGLALRIVTPGSNVISCENGAGGFSPIQASAFNPVSARRFKADIRQFTDPLEMVLDERVHAVRYTNVWTDEPSLGFVAEDWLGVLPEVVDLNDDGDVMALDYDRISAVTFEALKQHVIETNARLDALERMLAA